MASTTYCQPAVDESSTIEKRSPTRGVYRPEIDGLRAIAMIAVLINHFNPTLLPSGFLGVDIFFVISGFVVTSSLTGRPDQSWSAFLVNFYSRRVKRLIPALVFCVVLTSLLGCLFIDAELTQPSLRTGIFSLFGGSNLYILRGRTDYFGQVAELNLFTQTWSLGVEEQFYLLFPVLLGLCGYSRHRRAQGPRNLFLIVLGLSAASLALYLYLAVAKPAAAFFLMPARFWEVGAGCLIFLSSERLSTLFSKPDAIRQSKSGPPAIIAPVCAGLLIGALFLHRDMQIFATLASAALTTCLLWSFNYKGKLVQWLSSKWMVKIGLLSYSLYLWHWSVLVLSRWTVGISKWTVPFQLLLIVGLALFSNKFIETPLRHATWSRLKTRTIAYALLATVASASLLGALNGPLSGLLYTGKSYPLAHSVSFGLAADYEPCNSAEDRAVPADFAECYYPQRSVSEAAAATDTHKTFYFVGDSHTGSLQSLASSLVEKGDVPRILMLERDGCLFSTSLRRVNIDGEQCLASNRSFLSKLMASSHPGDVVVVTNRHSLYFLAPNAFDDVLKLEKGMFAYSLDGEVLSQRQALEQYSKDLVMISNRLEEKGIALVVQSSLPDWKHPPSQCQPQWFRPGINLPDDCELQIADELEERAPLMAVFQQMEQAAPNLYVYDPFSAFCSEESCDPFASDGRPLFRDANHLNDYGAEHLYTDFKQYLVSHDLVGEMPAQLSKRGSVEFES